MDVNRFIAVGCVKEKSVWVDTNDGWHALKYGSRLSLLQPHFLSIVEESQEVEREARNGIETSDWLAILPN